MDRRIRFFEPSITDAERQAVAEVLKGMWLTTGEKVAEFEEKVCRYVGAKYGVAVSSGTAALHLACLAMGVKDKVVAVPDITFIATAMEPIKAGAKVLISDVRIDDVTLDFEKLPSVDVVMPIDYGGNIFHAEELKKERWRGVKVIEDAAQSFGSELDGKRAGTFGDVGCFSFYASKVITTCGEGGMVVTDDEEIYRRVKKMRNHSMSMTAAERERAGTYFYDVDDVGFNYKMTEVQAAFGIAQLERIDEIIEKRRRLAQAYNCMLKGMKGIILPTEVGKSVWLQYYVRVLGGLRDRLFTHLTRHGIGVNVHHVPLHRLIYIISSRQVMLGNVTVADRLGEELLTLPIHDNMEVEDVEHVCELLWVWMEHEFKD